MKARTRNWGILLTFLFIGLAGYAGYQLYHLPISIADTLKEEKDARIREIRMLVLDNKDKRGKNLSDKELLKAIREELTREVKGRESAKLEVAQKLAIPTYEAFGLVLIIVIVLMFLLLTSSYRTSAETIVYIEKQEEEEEDLDTPSEIDSGKLKSLINDLELDIEVKSISKEYLENLLSKIAKTLNISAGAIYKVNRSEEQRNIELIAGYAFIASDSEDLTYDFGEGLAGQVAKTGIGKVFNSVPQGYIEVFSGLGEATPNHLTVLPLLKEKEVMGVMELAFLEKVSKNDYEHLQIISNLVGKNM